MIQFNDLTPLKNISKIPNFDEQYEDCKKEILDIFNDNKDCFPIFIAVTGSTSYGLSVETSDLDIKGIYIQDLDSILKEFKIGQSKTSIYKNQISNETNDTVFYELGRIMELFQTNNPNSLELLSTPPDCIVYKHPIWDFIIGTLGNKIITKKCFNGFKNYAYNQITKAKGLNKKINNPIAFERKTPLDFCYVINDSNSDSIGLRKYLEDNRLDQKLCGLTKVPHAKDMYSLYYDEISDLSFSKYRNESERNLHRVERKESGETMGLGYKGIIKEAINNEEEVSNEIRLSSISKEEVKICNISYNKDGYTKYCKDYKEYWAENGWINRRNEARYNDNIKSGQNFDCYNDEETEFLTFNGWKKYDDINDDDLLGTINQNDNSVEWQNYYERFDTLYNGKLYTYEDSKTRFSITNNHKLYFSDCNRSIKNNFSREYNKENKWYLQTVEEYFDNRKSNKNMLFSAENNNFKDIDISDDMLRLIGCYISEGSLYKNNSGNINTHIYISQLENGRLCKIMENITSIDYKITPHNRKNRNELTYIISDKNIVDFIEINCSKYSDKVKLPDSFLNLSSRQFKILFDAMMAGDGHYHKKKHLIYYTTSKILAEQIQILLTIHGYNSQFYGPYLREDRKDIYQIFISKKTFNFTTTISKVKTKWIIKDVIDKRVVCFSVKNNILITRNNKKVAIQSNCKNMSHCLRLLYMAKEISQNKGIIVRRDEKSREELLSVKKGLWLYEDIITLTEKLTFNLEEDYNNSDLPDDVSSELISELLFKIRKEYYGL